MDGFQTWIEMRFVIKAPDWHWPQIILHEYRNDQSCFDALPDLYGEFLRDQAQMGDAEIEAEALRRLNEKYGRDWGHPLE